MKKEPRIEFSTLFNKQRKVVPLVIKEAFLETLELFLVDPYHSSLRNHVLKEDFTGYRSVNITSDYRAVFKESYAGKQKAENYYLSHDRNT